MARKFDTKKVVSDKELFKQCFVLNDDFLDSVYAMYEKKYKNFTVEWQEKNWDSFVDDIVDRFEGMKKVLQKQIDTKK